MSDCSCAAIVGPHIASKGHKAPKSEVSCISMTDALSHAVICGRGSEMALIADATNASFSERQRQEKHGWMSMARCVC